VKKIDWVLIDVETSGESTGNYIIELGLVEMRGWKVIGKGRSWLINHDCDISYSAKRTHGISKSMLANDGMPPRAAYREIVRFLDGRPYGAHSLSFEKRAIASDFEHYGIRRLPKPGICTLRMARMFLGLEFNGLGHLSSHFRLRNQPTHRALPDARATAELAERVLSKHVDVDDFDVLSEISNVSMAIARQTLAGQRPKGK
jgi:DNA polymerase-3 subunit epsilon